MIRTDLVFRRNREELRGRMRSRFFRNGCLGLLAALAVAVLAAGWLYRDRVAPWLRAQRLAVAGRASLDPIFDMLDESDLSPAEKEEWTRVLETAWRVCEESSGAVLRRRDIIGPARRVLESEPGLYYGIRLARRLVLARAESATEESDRDVRLMTQAMDALKNGRIAPETRHRLNRLLPGALNELRREGTDEDDRSAARPHLDGFVAVLDDAQRSGAITAGTRSSDMSAELRVALRNMGREIEHAKRGERR